MTLTAKAVHVAVLYAITEQQFGKRARYWLMAHHPRFGLFLHA